MSDVQKAIRFISLFLRRTEKEIIAGIPSKVCDENSKTAEKSEMSAISFIIGWRMSMLLLTISRSFILSKLLAARYDAMVPPAM